MARYKQIGNERIQLTAEEEALRKIFLKKHSITRIPLWR